MTLQLADDRNQSVSAQLDQVYDGVDTRLATSGDHRCLELAANCRQLRARTRAVLSAAKRYDYLDVEANGYWTFSRLIVRFGQLVVNSPDDHFGTHLLPLSQVLLSGLDLCDQFMAQSPPEDLFVATADSFPELLRVFSSLQPQLDVVYGLYSSYWLCPSMRRVVNGFTTLMAVYSGGASTATLRTLTNPAFKAKTVANIAQNAHVDFVKSFWNLSELSFNQKLMPFLAKTPKNYGNISAPAQNRWTIVGDGVRRLEADEFAAQRPDIRCRLLHSADADVCTDTLVLHIHGGGFVAQSPDSHELYLRQWAIKLNQTAIVSVDYSLSPEAKYPTALQQVLDVYLWLTSAESVPTIGYQARKIVVCGDSAGGNLSVALCLVVHDIWRTGEPVVRPKGIVCFYTPFLLQTRGSPSRLMTAVDTLLPLGVLLSCLEAYAPDVAANTATAAADSPAKESEETDDELEADGVAIGAAIGAVISAVVAPVDSPTADGADFELISHDELPADEDLPTAPTPKWGHQWINASMAKLSAHSPFAGRRQMPRPWYRRPEPALGVKLESLNAVVNNPYISPLLSAPDFHDIPLYLVALVYDACLDDSVQMAKKWKGPVCLDVIDALPHGFLNFVLLSEEAQRAGDLCLDRVQQALT